MIVAAKAWFCGTPAAGCAGGGGVLLLSVAFAAFRIRPVMFEQRSARIRARVVPRLSA